MEAIDLDQDYTDELMLGSFAGMGINGDVGGHIGARLVESSPTVLLLRFEEHIP